jgi:hypothetical protein
VEPEIVGPEQPEKTPEKTPERKRK